MSYVVYTLQPIARFTNKGSEARMTETHTYKQGTLNLHIEIGPSGDLVASVHGELMNGKLNIEELRDLGVLLDRIDLY